MKNIIYAIARNNFTKAGLLSLGLCFLYVSFLSGLGPFRIAELKTLDTLLRLNKTFCPKEKITDKAVLISIDDKSIKESGIRWPWPRSVAARVLGEIVSHKPQLVCVDLLFVGKSSDEAEDAALAEVFRQNGNILIPAYFGADGRYITPEENIGESAKEFGFVNKPRDADGCARRMIPIMFSRNWKVIDYSLAVKVAARFLGKSPQETVRPVPLLEDDTAYIRFFGQKKDFTTIPAWKVLKGIADLDVLKDKIVFYGVTSELLHDSYPTPFGTMSGVILTLNETLTYASGKFFHQSGAFFNFTVMFLFCSIAVFSFLRLSVIPGIILNICGISSIFALSLFLILRNIIFNPFGVIFLVVSSSLVLYSLKYVKLTVENIILRREAVTDGLTGLYVYRYFELRLKREFKKTVKEGKKLALTLYDIDHFKNINDTYGHEFGNTVLRIFAKILRENTRKRNVTARYGGEEFCVLLPEMDAEDVLKYAERIRQCFKETVFRASAGKEVKITLSAGVVTMGDRFHGKKSPHFKNHTNFIKAADKALYASKNSGRDKVTVF
jgi:diguanylate cyclase (GGDEF)-like protein